MSEEQQSHENIQGTGAERRSGFSPHMQRQIEEAKRDSRFTDRAKQWAEISRSMTDEERGLLLALREQQAHIDSLTGELTRTGFIDHAAEALNIRAELGGAGTPVLLYGDGDGLKRTNDTPGFGRIAGDNLLLEIARSCRAAAGRADIVGRIGPDEFSVLFINATQDEVLSAYNTIQERLSELRSNGTIPEWAGASFGAVEVTQGQSVEDMLYKADATMKKAKESKVKQAGERGGHVEGLLYVTKEDELKVLGSSEQNPQ